MSSLTRNTTWCRCFFDFPHTQKFDHILNKASSSHIGLFISWVSTNIIVCKTQNSCEFWSSRVLFISSDSRWGTCSLVWVGDHYGNSLEHSIKLHRGVMRLLWQCPSQTWFMLCWWLSSSCGLQADVEINSGSSRKAEFGDRKDDRQRCEGYVQNLS